MDTLDLMRRRHSVRQYLSKPIEKEKKEIINNTINFINQKTGLNFKACYDEPTAFKSLLAHYGKFKNVNNYIVLAGDKKQEELVGYYGEILVLTAQELGLNTCWVALTYNKKSVNINLGESEKIHCVIALGYGVTPGVQSKCKEYDEVVKVIGEKPNYTKLTIIPHHDTRNRIAFIIVCLKFRQRRFRAHPNPRGTLVDIVIDVRRIRDLYGIDQKHRH